MPNAASLRRLGLVVALVATVAACGGAGAGRAADRGGATQPPAAATGPATMPAGEAPAQASQGTGPSGATGTGSGTAATPAAGQAGPKATPAPVDTSAASEALRELDSLLNATDTAISAEATAANTMGE